MKQANEKLENIINNQFYDDIVNMNEEFTKESYNYIEDEATFKDMALEDLNEWRFLKDGTIF